MNTHDVLDELGPVPAHRLDGLEDVDLAVLDHLLDARVRRAVDARAPLAVPAIIAAVFITQPRALFLAILLRDDDDGPVVGLLAPPLHHVHELDEGVGGGGHLVALRPAHQLEELARLGGRLHTRHQLGQRHDLKSVFARQLRSGLKYRVPLPTTASKTRRVPNEVQHFQEQPPPPKTKTSTQPAFLSVSISAA